ncbi:hypothetical protein F4553_003072 [Allocatelliglobosispora scoriae]|uniref:Uncharacterized protein n=1 Tax=Allocatelliglobosispora scoriae TaxID=643052 RepID=A0A841BS10_9ACTN|nr:hypothetical protein [Allocatelliglobosispora scoriae]MBB5869693.1 hypothetical protein [Allocatelliglobosispora scoriae]
MSSPDCVPDDLTIALAEYQQLADAGRKVTEQSGARFNFFLVVATAVAAVSAGMVSGGGMTDAKLGAIGTLGVLTLIMGLAIFVRLVEFSKRGMRYGAAHEALRTYLARRSPQLAPYMIMPIIGDHAVLRTRPGWRRDAISLAGTVGLLNSMLLALAGGLLAGGTITGWVPVAVTIALFTASYVLHLRYVRRAMRTCAREIADLIRERGLDEPAAPAAAAVAASEITSGSRNQT